MGNDPAAPPPATSPLPLPTPKPEQGDDGMAGGRQDEGHYVVVWLLICVSLCDL